MNFLESLASEWYTTRGYFVRTNIKANRRGKGGWDNELDVLAYDPKSGELVHLETSWDALTWDKREERFLTKKFVFSDQQYAEITGTTPSKIVKRAIVGTSRSQPKERWGSDIKVTTVPNFISEISEEMKKKHPMRDVIPETYPCLRSFQFVLAYGS